MKTKYMRALMRFVWGVLALLLLQLGAIQHAQAQQTGSDFDHSSTGYVLNAQHQNVRCETCHLKGVFKGTPTTCEACHGWNNPRAATVMPTNHIPTRNASCESCHAANMSQFNDALRVFSHVSVQSQTCLNCHDSRHPHPGVRTNPSDPTHQKVLDNNTSCGTCHTSLQFTGPKLPANHIPTAPVACSACHASGDFSLMPSITAIHANAPSSSSNCAQCHSAANAAAYAMPTMSPALVSPPGNHIDMNGQSCEVCHVGAGSSLQLPVTDGAKFSNSAFSHSGITAGCAKCHGPNVSSNAFLGVTNIVVMPPTSPAGDLSHLPTTTTCENCHAGSIPSGLLSVTAVRTVPGTGFRNAPPSAAMIHSGAIGTCSTCHEAGMSWVGVTAYPRVPAVYNAANPNQLYTGFHTRPNNAGSGFSIANAGHPPTGECSNCHTNTVAFGATAMPANHIPYAPTANCSTCHGDFSVAPTVGIIHANIQNTSANCEQCHSTANAARYGASVRGGIVTLPGNHISRGTLGCEACHVGANSSIATTPVPNGAKFSGSMFDHAGATASCVVCHGPTVTATTFMGVFPRTISDLWPDHVPTTASCEVCHGSAPSGLVTNGGAATFANAQFSHAGISSGCAACHGPTIGNTSFYGINNIIVMPATSPAGSLSHLPTSTTCENCHLGSMPGSMVPASSGRTLGTSLFRNSPPTAGMIHSGVTSGCSSCHEAGMSWVGIDLSIYAPTPNTLQGAVQYKGFQTRPVAGGGGYSIANGGHPDMTTGDCVQCHTNTIAFGVPTEPANHIPFLSGTSCSTCHTTYGQLTDITVVHSKLQSTSTNCEQCHSTANAAQYAPTTSKRAIKSPATNHIPMGNLGCASCHVGGGSGITTTPVTSGMNFANSGFSHSGIATGCSTCHGVNVVAGTFDGVTPKTQSGLPGNGHIPVSNNVGCETCHVNSIPTGLVPPTGYSGSPSFSGGQFIHTYIDSGCATCHGPTATSYYGVTNIVLMPATSGVNAHIPSSTTCENCHLGSVPTTLMGVTTARPIPGSGFANSPPDSTKIHSGITGNCSSCHEAGSSWVGMMPAYPQVPAAKNASNPAQLYRGFNTRPQPTVSGFSMADGGHPMSGDCAQCHGDTTAFGAPTPPTNHIPYASSASCSSCHVTWGTHPTITNIHANIQSTSTNCAQCHSKDNAALYTSASRTVIGPAATHVPMRGLGCESCHVGSGSSMATTPVTGNPTFGSSAFNHSGMTSNCAECHGQNVGPFQGISTLVVMPTSTTQGNTSHLPTSTTCENCHRASMPSALVPGNAAHLAPNSGFRAPAPTSGMIHAGVTGSCASCHEKDMVWMGVDVTAYALTVNPYRGFHTRPYATATTFSVADSVHPTGGDCSNCHTGFVEWATNVKPSNHIPTANVSCSNCHTSSRYSDMPTITAIHANAQSTTINCAQCHSAANATLYNTSVMAIKAPDTTHIPMGGLGCESCHVGANSSVTTLPVTGSPSFANSAFSHTGITSSCATCHGNVTNTTFQGGIVPVTMTAPVLTPVHVPNPAALDCGTCHLAIPTGLSKIGSTSATFANGMFSHTGITTSCDVCHGSTIGGSSFKGITAIVVLPSTAPSSTGHIPSPVNSSCETCHQGATPTTLVNASATVTTPGSTKFKLPAPTGTMIHIGVTTGCNACHEAGKVWVNNSNLYPPKPSSFVSGATYTGFHTRPLATATASSVADGNHPGTGVGDCSDCHGSTVNFSAVAKPTNHIPTNPTAQCQNCHTNIAVSGGSFVTSTIDFSVRPTLTNIHAYAPSTTANCAQCHSTTNAATYAIPSLGFTIKSPASVSNHIPFGATGCEVCHAATTVPVQTGATFAGGKFSHVGFTTGCATCHGQAAITTPFFGVTALVAIPSSTTAQGSGNHIPYSASCETCHAATVPSGLLSVTGPVGTKFATPPASGVVIHANSTGFACKTCHERGYAWLGMSNYPRTPGALNTAVPTTQYKGFQTRPGNAATTYGYIDANHTGNTALDTGDCALCHAGTTAFTGEGKPAGHMPTTVATCSTCHIVAGDYSDAGLASNAILHTGITIPTAVVKYTAATLGNASCKTCHTVGTGGTSGTAPFAGCATQAACSSPPPITYQPMTVAGVASHVPIGVLSCDACHVGTTSFGGVNMKSGTAAATMHANVTLAGIQCQACHEFGMAWTNVSNLMTRVPNKHTTTSRKAPNDCAGCHSFNGGFRGMVRPIMREALVSPDMGRMRPNLQVGKPSRGSLGNTYDHAGVKPAECKTCHNGKVASGMPARHLMVSTSCDTCHRTTSWTPAQFSHNGVSPNTCMACHNGMRASAKPPGHFMTARSCDSCHKSEGWKPVGYQHMSPQFRPSPDMLTCVSCHVTNGEIIPRQMRGLTRTKPIPVGP